MDPVVAVACQLVDAFTDALSAGDAEGREYAEEQLDEFIDELDDASPDEALVALLDLPLDGGTLPLLNTVSRKLAGRGPGVVEALLRAALGQAPPELGVRDIVSIAGAVGALLEAATRRPDLPVRTENAISVLHAMAQGDLIVGLIEVLEGPADERLKQAAGEMLVQIGAPADGDPLPQDVRSDTRAAASDHAVDAGDVTPATDPAGGVAPPPAGDDIDRGYDAFLERFKRETGQR